MGLYIQLIISFNFDIYIKKSDFTFKLLKHEFKYNQVRNNQLFRFILLNHRFHFYTLFKVTMGLCTRCRTLRMVRALLRGPRTA